MLVLLRYSIIFCYFVYCIQNGFALNRNGNNTESIQHRNCSGNSTGTDGCGRDSADQHNTLLTTFSSPISGPVLQSNDTQPGDCTDAEKMATQCVSDHGECFVYLLDYQRKPACHCNERYAGIRCEELNFEIFYGGSTAATLKTSVFVVGPFAVVSALIAIIFMCYRRRMRQRSIAKSSNHQFQDGDNETMQLSSTKTQPSSFDPELECTEKNHIINCQTTDI